MARKFFHLFFSGKSIRQVSESRRRRPFVPTSTDTQLRSLESRLLTAPVIRSADTPNIPLWAESLSRGDGGPGDHDGIFQAPAGGVTSSNAYTNLFNEGYIQSSGTVLNQLAGPTDSNAGNWGSLQFIGDHSHRDEMHINPPYSADGHDGYASTTSVAQSSPPTPNGGFAARNYSLVDDNGATPYGTMKIDFAVGVSGKAPHFTALYALTFASPGFELHVGDGTTNGVLATDGPPGSSTTHEFYRDDSYADGTAGGSIVIPITPANAGPFAVAYRSFAYTTEDAGYVFDSTAVQQFDFNWTVKFTVSA